MEKKGMTRSKAEVIVKGVTDKFFEAVAKPKLLELEVERGDFEDAMWLVLHRRFIIVED